MLKRIFIFAFLFLLFGACFSPKIQSDLKKLRANNYNFSDFKRFEHKGLSFFLPNYFKNYYKKDFLYMKDGLSLSSAELGVHFSCERFNESDAEDFRFKIENDIPSIEIIHKFYINQREKSLVNPKTALNHKIYLKNKSTVTYKIISGSKYNYGDIMVYFVGIYKKEIKGVNHFYILQMASSKEMSAYLLNDFRTILSRLK